MKVLFSWGFVNIEITQISYGMHFKVKNWSFENLIGIPNLRKDYIYSVDNLRKRSYHFKRVCMNFWTSGTWSGEGKAEFGEPSRGAARHNRGVGGRTTECRGCQTEARGQHAGPQGTTRPRTGQQRRASRGPEKVTHPTGRWQTEVRGHGNKVNWGQEKIWHWDDTYQYANPVPVADNKINKVLV